MDIELVNFLELPIEQQLKSRFWRNSSEVAPYFKIKEIDEQTHKKWLNSLQNDYPQNIAFVIKYNNEFIGVTYFHSVDYEKSCADWGIYIHISSFKGKGIGSSVLQKCIEYAHDILNLRKIFLDVLDTNQRAIILYEKFGFKRIGKNNSFYRYEYCLK